MESAMSERRVKRQIHPVRRNVRLLMLHNALHSMLFVLPVLVPYYKDVIGLGFREFLIGEVAFSSVIVLMEVPAGWLADVGQRRLVLTAGSLAEVAGFFLLYDAHNFPQALFAQASLGVAVGLVSGTNTAMLYDTLLSYRLQKRFRRLEGLRMATGLYVVGLASLAGGFLYALNPRLPLLLGMAVYMAAALAAFLMIEPERHRREAKHPLRDFVVTVKLALHGHPDIGALVIFCGVLFGMTQAGFWVQQPYWLARGVDAHWFGALALAGFTLAGLASHHGHRLESRLRRQTAFIAVLTGVAGSYLVSGVLPGLWSIPFLYASSVAYGFGMPLVQDVINARIDSSRRASIISTVSLAGRLMFIPIGAAVAQMSRSLGIDWTVSAMGLTLAVAGGCAIRRLVRLGVLR
jgi:hypothetical protein